MNKNLKIYNSFKKIVQDKKFNRFKLKPIAVVLTVVLITTPILNGCNKNNYYGDYENNDTTYKEYYYNDDENNDTTYTEYYYNDFEYDINNYEQVPNEILNLKFSIEESKLSAFQNVVSNLKVDYEKSKSYGVKQALKNYDLLNNNEVIESNDIIKNNKIGYDILYNSVLKNNKKYMKDNPNNNYYDELDDKTLSKVIEQMVETVNYNISQNKNINLNVLDHKLKNLKIFGHTDFNYGFYSQDGTILSLNLDIIPKKSNSKINGLEEIVIHETNHMIQDVTIKKDSNVEQNFGLCYQFKNLELNPLYWFWFIEASAQSNTLAQKKISVSDSIVYDTNVSSLNTLNSTSVLIKESPSDLANLTTKSDLNIIFDYFNCKNESEKEEIINMMVANNLVLETYDNIFSNVFYSKNNISDETNFKKKLQASISQTETKIFYNNLAEKLKGNSVKLNDVFSLISVFETELSKEIWYDSPENIKYMDDFYEKYNLIQNEFFELIAQKLNMSIDEIQSYYINFHNITDHSNFSNEMLTQNQNKFYKEIYLENMEHKTHTILEVYKNIKKHVK